MTKKHYQMIAKIIEENKVGAIATLHDDTAVAGAVVWFLENIAVSLASEFKNDNPRFDDHKFLEACGMID